MWIIMLLVGAMMGSFACCQAWRLHEKGKGLSARSECMNCRKKLAWYDNVPVFSWLLLRGRCRSCGARIGVAEILMEIGGALAFVGIYAGVIGVWNMNELAGVDGWVWARWLWLLALAVLLGILAVYDGKWGKLPTGVLLAAVLVAGAALVCREVPLLVAGVDMRGELLSGVVAIALLAGLYFGLATLSGGKLVGDGDWLLGLAIGLALFDWWLALLVLALANLLAVLYGALARKRKIYFGPFYVVAFVVAISLSNVLGLTYLMGVLG